MRNLRLEVTEETRIPAGWHIEKNVKPIPDRRNDYDFWHDDYDYCTDTGSNGLAGTAESVEDALRQIADIQRPVDAIVNCHAPELKKAIEESLIYGTGVMFIGDGKARHMPLRELIKARDCTTCYNNLYHDPRSITQFQEHCRLFKKGYPEIGERCEEYSRVPGSDDDIGETDESE